MYSTRKPFESAPDTWTESSWTTWGETRSWWAAARCPILSVSLKPFARQTSGMRYRAARRSQSSRNSKRV